MVVGDRELLRKRLVHEGAGAEGLDADLLEALELFGIEEAGDLLVVFGIAGPALLHPLLPLLVGHVARVAATAATGRPFGKLGGDLLLQISREAEIGLDGLLPEERGVRHHPPHPHAATAAAGGLGGGLGGRERGQERGRQTGDSEKRAVHEGPSGKRGKRGTVRLAGNGNADGHPARPVPRPLNCPGKEKLRAGSAGEVPGDTHRPSTTGDEGGGKIAEERTAVPRPFDGPQPRTSW